MSLFYLNDTTRIGFKTLELRNAKHNSPKKQTPENHKKINLLRILILYQLSQMGKLKNLKKLEKLKPYAFVDIKLNIPSRHLS